ncbi:hypothetical protein BURMUCGD2M_6453 [Burkholderia multivorans CGD2M]|uniref:Uncharacterized protein n=1 Tax=Burkholderia multivorans CGD2 TaxID=513052 RepID=B9BP42_9BURK|nr:hypothetical protein BURMUCGD2_6463 [Burkholderia multivorans CGD2]EEE13731.1 hypothetical protein BURMUCGD2M_6453 [Burkholderia multivorans CGD2M]
MGTHRRCVVDGTACGSPSDASILAIVPHATLTAGLTILQAGQRRARWRLWPCARA